MPYITENRREKLRHALITLGDAIDELDGFNAGDLNYLFTCLIQEYVFVQNGLNYQHINDVIGALEGAKAEFYRRVAAPYEEKKIKENGDVC